MPVINYKYYQLTNSKEPQSCKFSFVLSKDSSGIPLEYFAIRISAVKYVFKITSMTGRNEQIVNKLSKPRNFEILTILRNVFRPKITRIT